MGKAQRYCCICDAEVLAEQIGRYVYGACGDQLYQGTLGEIAAVTIPATQDSLTRLARLHASVKEGRR